MSAIKFGDIRPGDRVRQTWECGDVIHTREFTVAHIQCFADIDPATTWELIERPKPEFKPGQIWRYKLDGLTYDLLVVTYCKERRWLDITAGHFWVFEGDHDDLIYVGEADIRVTR